MKREKNHAICIAAALAFFVAFGGICCICSGFMVSRVNVFLIFMFFLLFSAVAAFCMAFRWGGLILCCVMAVLGGFLWQGGELESSMGALLYRISYIYNKGYGWGMIVLNSMVSAAADTTMALCALGVPVILAVTRTIVRRKKAALAVLTGFMPLLLCLVVTDTVPEVWCLFILLAAQLVLILTNTVRRQSELDGNRLTAILLVPVILCSLLMFWAVPPDQYKTQAEALQNAVLDTLEKLPFIDVIDGHIFFGFSGGSGTGHNSGQKLDLSTVGAKSQTAMPIMDVTASRNGTMYLRGQAYDSYDGTSWSATDAGSAEDTRWPQRGLKEVGSVKIATKGIISTLFLPYYAGEGRYEEITLGRILNKNSTKEYTILEMSLPSGIHAGGSEPFYPLGDPYLELPEETESRAKAILKSAVMDENAAYGASTLANMIGDYVRESAEYSLTKVERMPSNESDFAIWFLTHADYGYCIHFASAATVLLRAAGVPARYVTGYTAQVEDGVTVTVTGDKSHAWVEYYDSARGTWVVLDPTPSAGGNAVQPTEPSETTEPTQPSATTEPSTPTTSEPPASQTVITDPMDTTTPSGIGGQDQKPEDPMDLGWLVWIFAIVGGVAAVLGLIWGQYCLRRYRRRRAMHSGKANHRALERWCEVLRYSKLLQQDPPERLEELAEKAKFSQHTLTAEELKEFDAHLKDASRTLAGMKWYKRMWYRLVWAVK